MKRSTVTAVIIAVLLIATFAVIRFYRNSPPPSFSIVGEWTLDSAYAPTTAPDSIQLLTAAMNEGSKENGFTFHFLADSTLKRGSPKDAITEKYYLGDSLLYISEGKDFVAYPYITVSDSVVHFSNADSVVFVLKRK